MNSEKDASGNKILKFPLKSLGLILWSVLSALAGLFIMFFTILYGIEDKIEIIFLVMGLLFLVLCVYFILEYSSGYLLFSIGNDSYYCYGTLNKDKKKKSINWNDVVEIEVKERWQGKGGMVQYFLQFIYKDGKKLSVSISSLKTNDQSKVFNELRKLLPKV